ncbi:MAG: protein-export chaperone SecB [Nitrosomonadales bacterium]|nr:protein-export chaperone SecB [Nitrosomonadales bacterium]
MAGTEQENKQPTVGIDKIYLKDLSLEIPHAPQIFLERTEPQIELQLHSQAVTVGEGAFEVIVMATVTAKIGEKTMFLIEAKQAGIFQIRNVSTEDLEPILSVMCPNTLFPYLREVISDVVIRAGFVPLVLQPINFEAMYLQQKQQRVQADATTTH